MEERSEEAHRQKYQTITNHLHLYLCVLETDFSGNPNPNYAHVMDQLDLSNFELSDYLLLQSGSEEDNSTSTPLEFRSPNPISPKRINDSIVGSSRIQGKVKDGGVKKTKKDLGFRIAFRTKTELEILDDGFKWRKYGKKKIKNSPNPRNYYRCSSVGCQVKKRVERDQEDSSYVITTYDGAHNHES